MFAHLRFSKTRQRWLWWLILYICKQCILSSLSASFNFRSTSNFLTPVLRLKIHSFRFITSITGHAWSTNKTTSNACLLTVFWRQKVRLHFLFPIWTLRRLQPNVSLNDLHSIWSVSTSIVCFLSTYSKIIPAQRCLSHDLVVPDDLDSDSVASLLISASHDVAKHTSPRVAEYAISTVEHLSKAYSLNHLLHTSYSWTKGVVEGKLTVVSPRCHPSCPWERRS